MSHSKADVVRTLKASEAFISDVENWTNFAPFRRKNDGVNIYNQKILDKELSSNNVKVCALGSLFINIPDTNIVNGYGDSFRLDTNTSTLYRECLDILESSASEMGHSGVVNANDSLGYDAVMAIYRRAIDSVTKDLPRAETLPSKPAGEPVLA